MEKIILEHFYKHLYALSYAYYCDQYSSQCYNSEIKEHFLKAKTLKDVLDEAGINCPTHYVGYCDYKIDLTDFSGY